MKPPNPSRLPHDEITERERRIFVHNALIGCSRGFEKSEARLKFLRNFATELIKVPLKCVQDRLITLRELRLALAVALYQVQINVEDEGASTTQ